jgi:hypothetical protein
MSADDQVARALDRLCIVCEERERNDGHYWCQQCYENRGDVVENWFRNIVIICNVCGRPCIAGAPCSSCEGVDDHPAENASYEELLEWEQERNKLDDGTRAINRSVIYELPVSVTTNVQEICVVCQETFEEDSTVMSLKCGHFFHKDCVKDNDWFESNMTCPVCKTDISM